MASTSSLVKSLKVEIGCIYNLGMDIVQKIETFGTQAGRTTKKIVIARSGELWIKKVSFKIVQEVPIV